MSRTYRRRGSRHEHPWVLQQLVFERGRYRQLSIDPRSTEGRRAIARFHSDSGIAIYGGVPHWFRRIFKRSQKDANAQELLRWLADRDYDLVIDVRHRHSAQWVWW